MVDRVWSPDDPERPLSEEEKELGGILAAHQDELPFMKAILRGEWDGRPAAYSVIVREHEDGFREVRPIALLLTEDMLTQHRDKVTLDGKKMGEEVN